jgi:transcriptional regulator with XRE-family HTH domain
MSDNTSDFFSAKAFREACERVGMQKKAIAAGLGVTPTTVSSLLSGRTTPSLKLLTKMVEFFGCELADFLDMPPRQRWELKHYRIAAGFTQTGLAQELGVAPSGVSGWELGKYPPGAAALSQMAGLFGVQEDELRTAIGSSDEGVGDATFELARAMAETVLGFASNLTEMTRAHAITAEAREQLNAEIRVRTEQALTLLAGLIPQLPDAVRREAIALVRRLSEVHDTATSK